MLNDGGAGFWKKNYLFLHLCFSYYGIENKVWSLRCCFTVSLSTFLLDQVRSPGPQRRVQLVVGANVYDPREIRARPGSILRLEGANVYDLREIRVQLSASEP